MTKKNNLPFNALNKGYVLVPKHLLNYRFNQKDESFSYLEAFLMLITNVNFEDRDVTIKGETFVCKRGESVLSVASWAKMFNWTTGKTRWFFDRMEKENLISSTLLNYKMKSIAVIDYDLWTGKPSQITNMRVKNEDRLLEFYEKYHETTGLRKVDIGLVRREWKKLSKEEKEAAIKNIENYRDSVSCKEFVKSASSYLKAKSFYDQDVNVQSQPRTFNIEDEPWRRI
ncbi:hypothetical protein [uncultured Bacteroides sp.]|uniref:hypothetical protein n=1 Tax=uncultured Bacteroides sp. TaxID=162156 RepID=UPI002AAC3F43|nr:hypothetical protein [uncultured Bacteroides sp.]